MKKSYKVLALLLCFAMALSACKSNGGNDSGGTNTPAPTTRTDNNTTNPTSTDDTPTPTPAGGEPIVIKWGHNWPVEMDTSMVDETTGEPAIKNVQEYEARKYAEQQVLEKLNVKIEFVKYADANEEILQSVMAGKPFADIIRITNGNQGPILAQGVLQPLDDYAYLFEDEDDQWIYWDKVFGHNYFLNNVMRLGASDVILYNMWALDQVEALKVDGKTKYPADYYAEGTWTWSVMEDYLQKLYDYWPSSGDWRNAFQGYYNSFALMAVYSNGGTLYDGNTFAGNSDEAKEAIAYVDRLVKKGLFKAKVQDAYANSGGNPVEQGEFWGTAWDFQFGYSAMVTLPQWLAGNDMKPITDRGEAIGFVPFPRPDDMDLNDPNYRQLNDATDCYGIPKGLDAERTELAIKVFKEYTQSYHKKMANSDKAMDFLASEQGLRDRALGLNIDITNKDYGQNLLTAFKALTEEKNIFVNDFSKNLGIFDLWQKEIVGYSIWGLYSTPKYDVHVEASLGRFTQKMDEIKVNLNSGDVIDTRPPVFTDVKPIFIEAGTDPASINFGEYFTASDGVEGSIDISKMIVDYSQIDFNEIGKHDGKLIIKISDSVGNEQKNNKSITIYDGKNQTPPTLIIKEEYRTINLDENTSNINWHDDFVEHARDKDDLDIRNKDQIKVDLSTLDTTSPGEYDVEFTLTDYAGNQTKVIVKITVAAQ